jgi:hypothetical protein
VLLILSVGLWMLAGIAHGRAGGRQDVTCE